MVDTKRLKMWVRLLKEGATSIVIEDLEEHIQNPKTGKLAFHDIQIGETYQIRAIESVKKKLHGKKVKITDKKRTNVVGILLRQDGTPSTQGGRYSLKPEILEEAQ